MQDGSLQTPKKEKHQPNESEYSEVILYGREKCKIEKNAISTFYVLIGQLKSELHRWKEAYDAIGDEFIGFIELSTAQLLTVIEHANKLFKNCIKMT